jgi:peptidoglycan/xylan/chitin deacetylase (PgdA/CDA1 family)
MYPDFCIKPIKNKILAKAAREWIHRVAPEEFFIKFMEQQTNPFKKAAYTLTFDFDYETDITAFPMLLGRLKTYGVKAGFAVIGKFVEKYPDIHKRAVDEGHEIINHSYTHPDNPHWAQDRFFNRLSREEQKDEIYKAHEVFYNILGVKSIGFRTPHYGNLHTESVYDILAELGYKYSSSTAACAANGYGAPYLHRKGIVEIPTGCSLHYPMAIFDSWNMLRKNKPFIGDDMRFVREFCETLDIIKSRGLYMTHYFDPYDIVKNGKLEGILACLVDGIEIKLYKELF